MKYPDYRFVELAIGGVEHRNHLVDITKLTSLVRESPYECYCSVFRFTQDFRRYLEEKGTVAGYSGWAFADYLPFDIDAEAGDLEATLSQALNQARRLAEALATEFSLDKAGLRYYFSGKKGFHVLVPSDCFGCEPLNGISIVFKKLAHMVSEMAEVPLDERIYDLVRLFRIKNTRHKETDLYKIPLSSAEFDSLKAKEILSLAKFPREVSGPQLRGDKILSTALKERYRQLVGELKRPRSYHLEVPSKREVPPKSKLCYLEIMKGVKLGERDDCALRLAVYFKRLGYPSGVTLGALVGWNRTNDPPLEDKLLEKKVEQAYNNEYQYSCQDPILRRRCEERCYLRRQKQRSVKDLKSIEQLVEEYKCYIGDLERRQIHLGLGRIDEIMRGVAPGEVCEIIGLPTVGKTALALNILRNVSTKQQVTCLFFSLEQPSVQVFERAASISTEMSGLQIEREVRSGRLDDYLSCILADFKNVYVCGRAGLTLSDMKKYVLMLENETRKKVGFVVIDYLGLVEGVFGTSYEIITILSRQIKTFARQLEVAVCFVHHVSAKKKEVTEPIRLGDARDSSVAVDATDFLLGISRPDKGHIKLNLLKSRKGPNTTEILAFFPEKMIIRPL